MKIGIKSAFNVVAVLAAAAAASVLQGCASTPRSMPTPAKLVELGIVTPDADLESLKRGRTIAIMDCRQCHRQYWPQEYSAKRWPRLSRNMGRLAAMDRDAINDLMDYMIAASRTAEINSSTRQSRTETAPLEPRRTIVND